MSLKNVLSTLSGILFLSSLAQAEAVNCQVYLEAGNSPEYASCQECYEQNPSLVSAVCSVRYTRRTYQCRSEGANRSGSSQITLGSIQGTQLEAQASASAKCQQKGLRDCTVLDCRMKSEQTDDLCEDPIVSGPRCEFHGN